MGNGCIGGEKKTSPLVSSSALPMFSLHAANNTPVINPPNSDVAADPLVTDDSPSNNKALADALAALRESTEFVVTQASQVTHDLRGMICHAMASVDEIKKLLDARESIGTSTIQEVNAELGTLRDILKSALDTCLPSRTDFLNASKTLTSSVSSDDLILGRESDGELLHLSGEVNREGSLLKKRYKKTQFVFNSTVPVMSEIYTRQFNALKSMLDNCVKNSVTHGKASTIHIELTLCDSGKNICVVITDNGCGIPAPKRADLFNPERYQLTPPSRQRGITENRGEGMINASLLIKHCGGTVQLLPEPPANTNSGTSTEIIVPILPVHLHSKILIENVRKKILSGTKIILLVDDNYTSLTLLFASVARCLFLNKPTECLNQEAKEILTKDSGIYVLNKDGFCFIFANDGQIAAECFEHFHPSVVFTDQNMKYKNGLELALLIRTYEKFTSQRPLTPIGIHSADTAEEISPNLPTAVIHIAKGCPLQRKLVADLLSTAFELSESPSPVPKAHKMPK